MNNMLPRALVMGVILAIFGIGLFLFLYYIVFANAGDAVRLFSSLLLPPFVMAFLLGGYYILTKDEDE